MADDQPRTQLRFPGSPFERSRPAAAKSGYYFTIGGDLITGYTSLAQPAAPNSTGVRTFCSDHTLVLFYDAAGGACTTTTSSPL